MTEKLLVIPYPKKVSFSQGIYEVKKTGSILFDGPDAKKIGILLRKLLLNYDLNYILKSSKSSQENNGKIYLIINSKVFPQIQGYKLIIDDSITIIGNNSAGLFYGLQTLRQLLRQFGLNIPKLVIEDYPDFLHRGIMIDISRDRVPKMETLEYIIDKLSELKINQLQLYMEHTFAYTNHKEVWEDYSPLTHDEIVYLDNYCKERFIELVPNQNTFGHMSKWLVHEKYRHLAEAPDGYTTPWGTKYDYPFSLSPAVPESINLVEELLDELLPLFDSDQVNIGCDETFDLGVGKSQELCEKYGKGKVYFDFLMKIYTIAKKHKNNVMFWGDIIENHPEFIPLLPKDMIAMVWGYEENHPFEEKCELYSKSGLSFYVCPGTSTWNTFIGRTNNAVGNIRNAILNGKKYGAIGVLTTDWGDNGHVQHLPLSWVGYLYSAHLSWNTQDLQMRKFIDGMDMHIFESVNEKVSLGWIIYRLGTLHRNLFYTPNGTPFFYIFLYPETANAGTLRDYKEKIDFVANEIAKHKEELSACKDKKIKPICRQVINNISFAELGLTVMKLIGTYDDIWNIPEAEWKAFEDNFHRTIEEYKDIWLTYNRPGGLEQSLFKLSRILRVRQKDLRGLIF